VNELAKYERPSERLKQIEQVKAWMLEGQPLVNIIEALHESGETSKSACEIVSGAQQEWQELGGVDKGQILGFTRGATMHLYRKMIEIGDYANALKALKQLSNL
jgi:hypothetical protein